MITAKRLNTYGLEFDKESGCDKFGGTSDSELGDRSSLMSVLTTKWE